MGKKGQGAIPVFRVGLCGGLMPKQSVEYSAGYDLCVPFDTVVKRGRQAIPIGIKIGVPIGIDGHIRPRSGFSVEGMEGYTTPRFKWLKWFDLFKPKKKRFNADVIEGGTRIAQMVFSKHELPRLLEADELTGFDRGGGLGHTGTK